MALYEVSVSQNNVNAITCAICVQHQCVMIGDCSLALPRTVLHQKPILFHINTVLNRIMLSSLVQTTTSSSAGLPKSALSMLSVPQQNQRRTRQSLSLFCISLTFPTGIPSPHSLRLQNNLGASPLNIMSAGRKVLSHINHRREPKPHNASPNDFEPPNLHAADTANTNKRRRAYEDGSSESSSSKRRSFADSDRLQSSRIVFLSSGGTPDLENNMYPNTYDRLGEEKLPRPRPSDFLPYIRQATSACSPERLEECQQPELKLLVAALMWALVAMLASHLEDLELVNDQLKTGATHWKGLAVEYSGYVKCQNALVKKFK